MKESLDQKLCEKYPKIFKDRHGDPKSTLMCFGFECGDGWFQILDSLCGNIQSYIDWRNEQRNHLLESNLHNIEIRPEVPQVVAVQVKEKFAGLRFYYEGGDEYISGMVRMAESWASVTCEECGVPGEMRPGGWMKTLCDTHKKERDERYDRRAL